MIADVIGNYLDNLEEREFDAPFMALLRAMGFHDIHFLHGTFEFGKDFIAKRTQPELTQFAFQTKAGDIGLSVWNECRGQVDMLRTNSLAHPDFDSSIPRQVVLVTTGRLVGGAPLAAQQYREHLIHLREAGFETWDRETLVDLIGRSPEVGLANGTSDALLSLIGGIGEATIGESDLEKFSRRWFAESGDDCLARAALEAAIIGNRLRLQDRLDLAAFAALCLVRAAWVRGHGSNPADRRSILASDSGRNIFRQYATNLVDLCTEEALDPTKFIFGHREFSALVSYPVRCAKFIEITGLLGLLEGEYDSEKSAKIATLLARFCDANPGAAHPISDRWAISLVAPVLLLWQTGHRDTVGRLLRNVIKWVGDRYESRNLGLAHPYATPEEEVAQLVANQSARPSRRSESYVSSVVLDLCALLELDDLYELARNDFIAVSALPPVLEVPDSPSQYLANPDDARYEPNMPYREKREAANEWQVAPHHNRGPADRYLDRIGRSWDLLASISVLRDRHFVQSLRAFVEKDEVGREG
jgi:hypothetical protein